MLAVLFVVITQVVFHNHILTQMNH